MRLTLTFALTLALAALTGCAGASNERAPQSAAAPGSTTHDSAANAQGGGNDAALKTVSLQQTEDATTAAPNAPAAVERRIIRNATLTLEADEPSKAMQRIASLAEAQGGFVVTSESRQQSGSKGRAYEVFTIEIRVPAARFDAVIGEIRAAAGSVTAEKITGKDVTEEYIDLEARLRTQRALEAQLMEIMKRAQEVEDAISVQRELTNVRTEIERLEGRRRFLENQSSLSTISVTIQPPSPLVSTTGFFHSLGQAFGQGVDIAAAVTLFLITALLSLLPVVILVGVPAYFLLRYLIRRARRNRPPVPPQPYQPQPPAQEYQPPPPPQPNA